LESSGLVRPDGSQIALVCMLDVADKRVLDVISTAATNLKNSLKPS